MKLETLDFIGKISFSSQYNSKQSTLLRDLGPGVSRNYWVKLTIQSWIAIENHFTTSIPQESPWMGRILVGVLVS